MRRFAKSENLFATKRWNLMEKWRTKSEAEKEIEFNILLFKFPQNFNSQMMHF